MSTKKPRIQCILELTEYEKFKEICKIQDRTESKMASIMINEYIKQYEKEQGRVKEAGVSISKIG